LTTNLPSLHFRALATRARYYRTICRCYSILIRNQSCLPAYGAAHSRCQIHRARSNSSSGQRVQVPCEQEFECLRHDCLRLCVSSIPLQIQSQKPPPHLAGVRGVDERPPPPPQQGLLQRYVCSLKFHTLHVCIHAYIHCLLLLWTPDKVFSVVSSGTFSSRSHY
jgi:hypothetical protein